MKFTLCGRRRDGTGVDLLLEFEAQEFKVTKVAGSREHSSYSLAIAPEDK